MLTPATLPDYQRAIADAGVDGWLLYDFRGCNPVASFVAGVGGFITRRYCVWIPREGKPVALTHAIEQETWRNWPAVFGREVYASWPSLEQHLARLVQGKRIAMEYSAGNAVPYVDRVPAGAIDMVRAAGAEVVSSGNLVTRFYAVWTPAQLAAHCRAAEHVARIGRAALVLGGQRARTDTPIAEHELSEWIVGEFTMAGLEADHAPNVSVGAHAADPHHQPSPDHAQVIRTGDVVLIDLWATEPGGIYADQTYMAVVGPATPRHLEIWAAIRDARDAAIDLARRTVAQGTAINGAALDDVARRVIVARGFGDAFTHRLGHSIDAQSLHGSGPNLDNLETREERLLIPGVGFSIEPGIYLRGEVGMRTEVNAYFGEGEVIITPSEIQRELMIV